MTPGGLPGPRWLAVATDRTPITTVALDRRIDLDAAGSKLAWSAPRRHAHGVVYDLDDDARLYLFDIGAVVLEGLATMKPSLVSEIEQATQATLLADTVETYQLRIDPERTGRPRVGWDEVVIPEASPMLVEAVALLLAQSAALERYETGAERLLQETLVLARQLEARGRPLRTTKKQLRRVGRLTGDRLELARYFYLLDRPEVTWEDADAAQLYDSLFRNLELEERHGAVLQKLATVEATVQMVVNLWHGSLSNRLEWAIVVLIVVEITLALLELI